MIWIRNKNYHKQKDVFLLNSERILEMPRNKEFDLEFEKEKSCNLLYISKNEIWECNNERNGKVSSNCGIIFSLVIIHAEYAIVK